MPLGHPAGARCRREARGQTSRVRPRLAAGARGAADPPRGGRARAAPRAADQPARPAVRGADRERPAGRRWPWPRRRPPDAVILDLGLPDIDGIEVIGELRGWSQAPVIVLSGADRPGRQDRRARRRRRRLRDQAVRHGGAAGPAARRAAPRRRRDRRAGQGEDRPWQIDLAATRQAALRWRQDRAAHADRMAAAGDPAAPPRPAGRRRPAAHRGLGTRVRAAAPTTCASTWPGCAASWRTIRPGPGIC